MNADKLQNALSKVGLTVTDEESRMLVREYDTRKGERVEYRLLLDDVHFKVGGAPREGASYVALAGISWQGAPQGTPRELAAWAVCTWCIDNRHFEMIHSLVSR